MVGGGGGAPSTAASFYSAKLCISVDVKIEETRRNLFHVNVSESNCSEVETETSKVKKHVNTVDDADMD